MFADSVEPAASAGFAPTRGLRELPRALEISELVLARVRAWMQRRRSWLRHTGRESAEGHAESWLEDALGDRDAPEAERAWAESQPALASLNQLIATCSQALAEDTSSPLARLRALFDLSETDCEALQLCLAVELEPTLRRVCALLQPSAGAYPTEWLVARLSGSGRGPVLSTSSRLLRWEIVERCEAGPGEPAALRIDPHILEFVCGRITIDSVLFDVAKTLPALEPLGSWPLARAATTVRRALESGSPVRVTVTGPSGRGRRTFAAALAAALGWGALAIDTSSIQDADLPRVHLRAQRQALLVGLGLIWHGAGSARRRPALPGWTALQFFIAEGELALEPDPDVVDQHVALPELTIDERVQLWLALAPSARTWPAAELARLAERFRLEVADLAAIGRHGPLSAAETRVLCRQATRDRLGELGELLEGRFTRADLVLPEALDQRLDDLLFEARERARFWEASAARRLFPRGTGLIALLAGPTGTGKTMAAQVLAAELELDLFRVDLASCISKYIGETAKNLRQIFLRAEQMNAVLLFDEADALFSKRTDVRDSHDRHANADTNYLLQLLETFRGIALLSSNKRENLDAAFVRRIRYILEFARPGAEERRRIWRQIVVELGGTPALLDLEPALASLAQVLEMSGAQIKLSVLSALFAARRAQEPLALCHLLHGVGRELSKEGRGVAPKDRERIEAGGASA
jgi:hypothetical protein